MGVYKPLHDTLLSPKPPCQINSQNTTLYSTMHGIERASKRVWPSRSTAGKEVRILNLTAKD